MTYADTRVSQSRRHVIASCDTYGFAEIVRLSIRFP